MEISEDWGCKIEKEMLCEDKDISGGCLMAADAECDVDLRTVLSGTVTIPRQTHSLNVGIVKHSGEVFPDTDAILCFTAGVPVGVVTADCVPILIHAPDIRCVGAIHAGWRATLGGIVEKALDLLEEEGADIGKMRVYFGPSISQTNYEVDGELAGKFQAEGFSKYVVTPEMGSQPHIDLQGINAHRFMLRGVRAENIHLHPGCTYASRNGDSKPRYQSHRRSKGNPGRMVTYIEMH